MKKQALVLVALVLTSTLTQGGKVLLGGSNYVIGQGIEPAGLTFGLNSVAFDDNGEVDLTSYALEGTLGDIERFELYVATPHTTGWTWVRMEYHDGANWVPLVSFVVDDKTEDPYMSHAEWPDDNGYDDGWTAWGTGTYGMAVDRADTNNDGTPDAWKVYQVDAAKNTNLVHTYAWDILPDATGPGAVSLTPDTRIRFYALGKWDSTEALATFAVRGGTSVTNVRFGPLQSTSGSLIQNVKAATTNADEYAVTQYTVGIAMHPSRGDRTIASLPGYLDGAEGIKTSQSDRGVVGELLSFDLTAPAHVYVGWDARCTEATWLASGGWTLLPDAININQDPDAPTRQIWRKYFPAGTVKVPGPECDGRNNLFLMAVPVLRISGVATAANGSLTLTWDSQTGKTYRVEYRGDAVTGEWTLLNRYTATGASTSATDPSPGTGPRFYRVVQE